MTFYAVKIKIVHNQLKIFKCNKFININKLSNNILNFNKILHRMVFLNLILFHNTYKITVYLFLKFIL